MAARCRSRARKRRIDLGAFVADLHECELAAHRLIRRRVDDFGDHLDRLRDAERDRRAVRRGDVRVLVARDRKPRLEEHRAHVHEIGELRAGNRVVEQLPLRIRGKMVEQELFRTREEIVFLK